ncbi:MAG: sulfotransferase domain-containing protein [Bacteroidales bacterium]
MKLITSYLRPLPDFLIIGAQKGGTSSLFNYLNQHPGVRLPKQKEIHFFDYNYNKGLQWYRNWFPFLTFSGKVTGEASPYYLFHPVVPRRVFCNCPNVKIIVLLRNPIDRAYSHYIMEVTKGFELSATFEEAIDMEEVRLAGEYERLIGEANDYSFNHQHFSYLSRGLYFEQIKEWMKYFPPHQFLFIRSESFFANTISELNKVFEFLNLPIISNVDLTPENSGSYAAMKESTRGFLEKHFNEPNNDLKNLLGEDMSW